MSTLATATVVAVTQPNSGVWSDVVVAAVVAGTVSFVVMLADHRRAHVDRLRNQYADAFRAYAAYREFPYVIRRRGSDDSAERSRITEELRRVQEQLTFSVAWMELESPDVSRAYVKLVDQMRDVAGNEMRRAWELPAAEKGSDMNIASYQDDLKALRDAERAFLAAADKRLHPVRSRTYRRG